MLLKNDFLKNKFNIIKIIEEGTFGIIYKAKNIKNNQFVAIKELKIKYKDISDSLENEEILFLKKYKHKNLINYIDYFYFKNTIFIVFEFFKYDLFKYYSKLKMENKRLTNSHISKITYQIVCALDFLHKNNIMHRDIKPENILIDKNLNVKLCDFGIIKNENDNSNLTDYICTRWYRSPEILLKNKSYNCKIDIFPLGLIITELYLFDPLLPGENELDQLNLLFKFLGTPSKNVFNNNLNFLNHKFKNYKTNIKQNLYNIIPKANYLAIDLIIRCLDLDPNTRISAKEIWNHPFLKNKTHLSINTNLYNFKPKHNKLSFIKSNKNINQKMKKCKTFWNLKKAKNPKINLFSNFVMNHKQTNKYFNFSPTKINYKNLN